jgi:hypothetical protein
MGWHVLFVPWPRALGDTLEEHTLLASDVRLTPGPGKGADRMKQAAARMKHPERPHTGFGLEYKYKNEQWRAATAAKGKEYTEVWYTGTRSVILSSLDATGVVYVRGHSLPGSSTIFSKTGGERSHLRASEVGDRLMASGLRETFAGDLKCYNCHSAEAHPETATSGFAQQLADYLFDKGFVACRYWGYAGALSSFPEEALAGKGKVMKTSNTPGSPQVRARVARRRIMPAGLIAAEAALSRFR